MEKNYLQQKFRKLKNVEIKHISKQQKKKTPLQGKLENRDEWKFF